MIPKGPYCYDENGLCPNYTTKWVDGVEIYWCKYLKQGDLGNNITDDEIKALKRFHKTDNDEEIYKLYPLFILWDQVKECSINDEDEDEI